jgi:hypothetical protein
MEVHGSPNASTGFKGHWRTTGAPVRWPAFSRWTTCGNDPERAAPEPHPLEVLGAEDFQPDPRRTPGRGWADVSDDSATSRQLENVSGLRWSLLRQTAGRDNRLTLPQLVLVVGHRELGQYRRAWRAGGRGRILAPCAVLLEGSSSMRLPVSPAAATSLYLLIGKPVADNPTQEMLEAAFASAGLDARYVSLEVEPAALGDAVELARALGGEDAQA